MVRTGRDGPLTALQIAVLRVFWARGAATVPEVHDALHAERELAPTTVATLVTRLWRRGLLRRAGPRPYRYEATRTEAELQREGIDELAQRVFAGDRAALLDQLLRQEASTPAELRALRRLIERRERELEEESDV